MNFSEILNSSKKIERSEIRRGDTIVFRDSDGLDYLVEVDNVVNDVIDTTREASLFTSHLSEFYLLDRPQAPVVPGHIGTLKFSTLGGEILTERAWIDAKGNAVLIPSDASKGVSSVLKESFVEWVPDATQAS